MSNITNVAKKTDNEKVNLLRGAIGHRSTWMGLTYLEGKEAGGAENAEKFARKAIRKTGVISGEKFKKQNPASTSDCREFEKIFLNDTLRDTFEMDIKTLSEDRLDIEFNYCPLVKAWQDLGMDDKTCALLCEVAMEGDRGIADGMGLEFNLGDTIANGNKICQVSFFKKK